MLESKGRRGDAVRIVGLGMYWAWVYLSFNQELFLSDGLATPATVMAIHIVSCLFAAAAFFAVLLFRTRLRGPRKRRVLAAGTAMCSVGTMLYALRPFSASYEACLVGAAISGVAASVLVLAWGERFSDLSEGRAVVCTACSHGFALLVFEAAIFLGSAAVITLMLLAPLVSGVLALRTKSPCVLAERPAESEGAPGASPILSRSFSLGLCIVAFAYGGIRVFALSPDHSAPSHPAFFGLAGGSMAVLLLAVSFFRRGKDIDLSSGYRTALPIIVLACSVFLLLGSEGIRLAWVLNSAATTMVEMLTWIVLVEVCRSSRHEPLAVFAAGRALVHVGMMLGEFLGWRCVLDDVAAQFCVVLIVLLTLATSLLFSARDGSLWFDAPSKAELSGDPADEASAHGLQDAKSKLALMADRHGLSPREKEVFLLWASGYGSKYVQEKLCISASTVKTHVRHVYGKLGVQNRAELMLLIEQER